MSGQDSGTVDRFQIARYRIFFKIFWEIVVCHSGPFVLLHVLWMRVIITSPPTLGIRTKIREN